MFNVLEIKVKHTQFIRNYNNNSLELPRPRSSTGRRFMCLFKFNFPVLNKTFQSAFLRYTFCKVYSSWVEIRLSQCIKRKILLEANMYFLMLSFKFLHKGNMN